MSEEWKNSRMGAEIAKSDKEIMEQARLKVEAEKLKAEDQAWSELACDLYVGDSKYDSSIDWVLRQMRDLGYSVPVKKVD